MSEPNQKKPAKVADYGDGDLGTRLTVVETRLTVVEDRLTTVETQLKEVQTELKAVDVRLTRIEELAKHLPRREDLQKISEEMHEWRVELHKSQADMLKWMIATTLTLLFGMGALFFAFLRFWPH